MSHYIFNLEIEPNYLPHPMPEERTENYRKTVELLESLGVLGQFSVQENGLMVPEPTNDLDIRKAHFDIFDREIMHHTDFTDPKDREKIIKAVLPDYRGVISNFIRFLLSKGVGNSRMMMDKVVEGTVITPLGRQSLHIHYMGGGIDYIEERRYGLIRKGVFLKEVSTDFELYRNLRT